MKKLALIIITLHCSLFTVHLTGQTESLILTFGASYYEQYVPVDSLFIENLSQVGDTMLYYPDTLLTLIPVGTGDLYMKTPGFDILPNVPNPFRDKTNIRIYLPGDDILNLEVYDLSGQKVASLKRKLCKGHHAFTFSPGNARIYMLTATVNGIIKSRKMVGLDMHPGGACRLEYSGMTGSHANYKSSDTKTDFYFTPGDTLRFTAFATTLANATGSGLLTDAPESSQDYTIGIMEGIPCPGIPLVPYEGQTYHTVQIGPQCWFKENLNIGMMIEGTQTMQNNGEIEKYCYDNIAANCDEYGGFYQWNEIMNYTTTQGVQGICPPGWHIPTESELTSLVIAMGGQPLAGGKLKETGTWHWVAPNTGATNGSGFTFYGSGFRFSDGTFDAINGFAGMWTSTENPGGAGVWGRVMFCDNTTMPQFSYNKILGFNVRCIKND